MDSSFLILNFSLRGTNSHFTPKEGKIPPFPQPLIAPQGADEMGKQDVSSYRSALLSSLLLESTRRVWDCPPIFTQNWVGDIQFGVGLEIREPVWIEIQAIFSNLLYINFFQISISLTLVASLNSLTNTMKRGEICIISKFLFPNRIFQVPEAPL